METFRFDGNSEDLQTLIDLHGRGGKIICPICGNELLVIVGDEDKELMQKYQRSSGIYCLTNPKHMYRRFMMSDIIEKFRRRFGLE